MAWIQEKEVNVIRITGLLVSAFTTDHVLLIFTVTPGEVLKGVESCTTVILGRHFLLTYSGTFAAQCTASQTNKQTNNIFTVTPGEVSKGVEVYKMMNGLSAVQFNSFFELDTNTWTRRHSLKLKKKSLHTELRQHLFSELLTCGTVWMKRLLQHRL